MTIRVEKDSLGEIAVPINALWKAQTQRAINNFPISHQPLPKAFIDALLKVKRAAAQANGALSVLPLTIANAIVAAIDELQHQDDYMQHFPIDVFQTGSGTSTNMNANEVIATLASQKLNQTISENDHINASQSSNDTIPTAIQLSCVLLLEQRLLPALIHLQTAIQEKAQALDGFVKTGRTHLMDAMPVRFSQSLLAWADQIESNKNMLIVIQQNLQKLPQGGTAVGTGVNTHTQFANYFNQALSAHIGLTFTPAQNFFSRISAQDNVVALSGQLKTLAVSLLKIANDLRWMNSGPLSGLAEIELEALQPGSSIMPGKVNPVIPEAVAMVAAQVIGNDTAITLGGQSGNFELNVMLPMIAANIVMSLEILSNACELLADKAISNFRVNSENISHALSKNPILVTALNPIIGYAKAAEIAKQAYKEKRAILDVAAENTSISRAELEALLDAKKLTFGGH